MASGREIRLLKDAEGRWSAIDEETGVASRGETRMEALEMLDRSARRRASLRCSGPPVGCRADELMRPE
jgi:hypothetical protein